MHFAYPPRKSSDPPPFRARTSRLPVLRRSRLKIIAIGALAFFALLYLITRSRGVPASTDQHVPSGQPPAVIVTVMDETSYSKAYTDLVKENRQLYAEKWGYETFFPKLSEYDLKGSPLSWSKVVAMRHALTKYPDAAYVWYLDQDAFIMNPLLSVEDHLMHQQTIEENMIRDHPVVPPDSIIKTFTHLQGNDVDLMVTQDKEGLSTGSFIVRNSVWAKFFLETWYDPIYRSYNFQKAETHALEHIVQWHPTILSKLALVPQRLINAYINDEHGAKYEIGDVIVRFVGCLKNGAAACETTAQAYAKGWRDAFQR